MKENYKLQITNYKRKASGGSIASANPNVIGAVSLGAPGRAPARNFTEARRAIPQPKSWADPEEPDPPAVSTEPIDDDDAQANEEPIETEFETEAVAVAC